MAGAKEPYPITSLFRSKRVVVAVCAAAGMVLGAMSVSAAIQVYQQITDDKEKTYTGSVTAAEPGVRTNRHSSEQVISVTASLPASSSPPTQSEPTTSATDTGQPPAAATNTTPPKASKTAPQANNPGPVHIATPSTVGDLVHGVKQAIGPVVPPPLSQVTHAVDAILPDTLNAGLISVEVPLLGL